MWKKILREVIEVLAEIRTGDVMSVYATIYGVVFIGSAAIIALTNKFLGIFLLVFSPIPIFLLTILTKIWLSRFSQDLSSITEKAPPTIQYPKFVNRFYHVEYRANSDAEVVGEFIENLYKKSSQMDITGEIRYITKAMREVTRTEKGLKEKGIIVSGVKLDNSLEGHVVAGLKLFPNSSNEEYIENMFYITVTQGEKNISVINFDTDYKDIFPFSEILFQELKKGFSIENLTLPKENNINTSTIDLKVKKNDISIVGDSNTINNTFNYGVEKKEGIDYPYIKIQNIPSFLKNSAIIRVINNEPIKDLQELRVELKKLHTIINGVKSPDGHTFNPSTSTFDCGDGKIGYGGGAKDIQIASNQTHNLTFLTSSQIQLQNYQTDEKRDEITYEIEVWIYGKLDGNPIVPPLQFCGKITFWRAVQLVQLAHDVSIEQQISQLEMTEVKCENAFRWWIS